MAVQGVVFQYKRRGPVGHTARLHVRILQCQEIRLVEKVVRLALARGSQNQKYPAGAVLLQVIQKLREDRFTVR